VHGPFTVIQSFSITPAEGKAFVEASGDTNPIHVEDTIVPGAMTAARFLLAPEILVAGLEVRSLRVKFRAFSRYDRPLVNVYGITPSGPRAGADARVGGGRALAIAVRCYQQGTLVADAVLAGTVGSAGPSVRPPASLETSPAGASVGMIREFLRSVRVAPDGCLSCLGLGYPRAFLASLPPGAMVRMGGAGGLLNVLDLEFPEGATPHIEDDPIPTAEVEAGRPRQSFLKILARVGTGIKTYCRGSATVLASVMGRGAGLSHAS
jgi:hypothetical protein